MKKNKVTTIRINDESVLKACVLRMLTQEHDFQVMRSQPNDFAEVAVLNIDDKLVSAYLDEFDYRHQLQDIMSWTDNAKGELNPHAQEAHIQLLLWNPTFSSEWHKIPGYRKNQITNVLGFYPGNVSDNFYFESTAEYRVCRWIEVACQDLEKGRSVGQNYQVGTINQFPKDSIRPGTAMKA